MSIPSNPSPVASSVLYASLATNPPRIVQAQGNWLTTDAGTHIFDASGGAAVSCIGHGHPRVKRAIADQLDAVEYCFSPWFTTPAYERLSKFLTDSTGGAMERVFVCGSDAEAVEAALKMARQYFMELPVQQPRRARFISRDRSYHGNTLGALAVSGHKTRRAIYEPILSSNFSQVSPCYPYRGMREGETEREYVARLAKELDDEFRRLDPETVCAFVAETVAGLVSSQAALLFSRSCTTNQDRRSVAFHQCPVTSRPCKPSATNTAPSSSSTRSSQAWDEPALCTLGNKRTSSPTSRPWRKDLEPVTSRSEL